MHIDLDISLTDGWVYFKCSFTSCFRCWILC